MLFEIVGEITDVETIAVSGGIRDLNRLRRAYGLFRWRKRKGVALVRLEDGTVVRAELHWYEATGLGKRELKIKRWLE
ncbi:MAG TPA: hypothetical protein VF789_09755 [Thermoanaerobaculia bacterium]